MAKGECRTAMIYFGTKLSHYLDWPDFGPGHLPTSASQGISSENVLSLWGCLDQEHRITLEKMLRELSLSHFA